ncbi:MAG: antitoxin Xre/MbcA/ParS toxin-binding domain-containing protein [Acidobacteriota bacterium]
MAEDLLLTLLGGQQAIGKKVQRDLDFDTEIRQGFRHQVFVSFKTKTKLSNSVLSRILGVSARSIDRLAVLKGAARMGPVVSDRLYRTAKIVALAVVVMENRDQALEWLSSRQRGLGNRKPFDLIETDAGTKEVQEELLRIEHGFVA